MTKKDLFRLIIKIFGLYSIITTVFSTLPGNILLVINEIDMIGIIWIIGTSIVVLLLFMLLIYKPDKIITWLKLDSGFDNDRTEFQSFNTDSILKLAIIVIGGILLIKNVPAFLSHTLFAFKSSIQIGFDTNGTLKYPGFNHYWLTSFLNIFIGYLLLTNYNFISRIFKNKDSN